LRLLVLVAAGYLSQVAAGTASAATACAPGAPPLVFLVATGRSGSTSLLTLLREVPGSEFLGENAGVSGAIFDLSERLRMSRAYVESEGCSTEPQVGCRQHRAAWLHNHRPDADKLKDLYRELLFTALSWPSVPDVELIGFKEIRWTPKFRDVRFWLSLFPCAKVIFNIRPDVQSQLKSGFWDLGSTNKPRALEKLMAANSEIRNLHKQWPDQSRLLPIEQLSNISALQGVIDWLGLRRRCTVMRAPHENVNGTNADGLTLWGEDELSPVLCTRNSTGQGCVRNPLYKARFLQCD
jgi:hypothetical protein